MSTNQAQPPLDPIAQLVAKYQSNGHQPATIQPPPQPPQKKRDRIGFSDKTLWDWLNLLGVFLVPLMIGVFTIATTIQQAQISQRQHDTDIQISQKQHDSDQQIAKDNRQKDIQIADDQQKEDVLVNYQKDTSDLLLIYKLGSSKEGDPVRVVARAKTLTSLRRLDGDRKGTVIRFLYEAKLIGGLQDPNTNPPFYPAIVSLDGADLSNINLIRAYLSLADLRSTYLIKADMEGANLSGTILWGADLEGVNLEGANLSYAILLDAKVTQEQLAQAKYLKGVTLPDGSKYPSQSYPIPNHTEP